MFQRMGCDLRTGRYLPTSRRAECNRTAAHWRREQPPAPLLFTQIQSLDAPGLGRNGSKKTRLSWLGSFRNARQRHPRGSVLVVGDGPSAQSPRSRRRYVRHSSIFFFSICSSAFPVPRLHSIMMGRGRVALSARVRHLNVMARHTCCDSIA